MSDKQQSEPVQLPNTLSIPGLIFRKFRGESDYAAMRSIADAIKSKGKSGWIPERLDIEDLRANHASRAMRECLFAEVSGQTVGFTWLIDPTKYRGTRVYMLRSCVLSEWHGKGIGMAMRRWQEERALEIAGMNENKGDNVSGVSVKEGDADRHAQLENDGYKIANTVVHMEHLSLDDVFEAPIPSGIEIRPIVPEHYDQIWGVLEACFNSSHENDGRSVSTIDANNRRRYLSQPWCDPSLWRAAWDEDVVVGVALNGIEGGTGETHYVAVMPAWRRRGISRAILTRSLITIRDRDIERSLISTEDDNRNNTVKLYEGLGYRVYEREFRYWKRLDV